MTIEAKLKELLEQDGLWPDEASAIVAAAKADPKSFPNMEHGWTDPVEGYPVQYLAVLLLGVHQKAVEWLKANKPKHFLLPMLDVNHPEHAAIMAAGKA